MAMNKEGSSYKKQPLALPIIVDIRKFADDQSNFFWRYTKCVSAANLLVNPTDNMTITDIFNSFRKDLNTHIKDGFFYWINNGNFLGKPDRAYGMKSSIGAVKLSPPILDFFIQSKFLISKDLELNAQNGTGLSIFSFSKVTPDSNTFCLTVYFDNSNMLMKETMVLRESFKYFITKIPVDYKYNEDLKELQNFQKKLLDEY